MDCRKWKLAAVGLALLCGACGRSAGTVPSPTAAPVEPAVRPAATGRVVAAPVPTASMDRRCPPTEPSSGADCDREVLLAARDVLRGTNTDALGTWQRDRPLGLFEGVRVDPFSGRVVKIEDAWLTPLVGSIPPQLGQLSQLRILELDRNRLAGPIPPQLGQLGQLQVLNLGHNWLTGPIPPQLGQLGQLRILNLSFNRLTGVMPPELGQLGQLQRLELDRNRLAGSMPPQLGQLSQLQALDLSYNQLTGSMPPQLGQLSHLQGLDLRNNGLTGSIPPTLGQLGQLGWLRLDHNRLTGSIPPQLGQLGQLQALDLSHNLLTGSMPSQLGRLCRLEWLSLGYNQLTGFIPPQLGHLGHLRELDLSHNLLTGSIPMPLEPLLHVRELNLTGNRLTDTTPPAREPFNQSGIPPVVGIYTDPAAHWGGQYRVLRQGRQVTATLAVHRSAVGHGAPPQPLFRLPEGYRPRWPRTWTTAAWPMTARGRPLPEAPAVTVILEARPDGTVYHLDAPTLEGAGYAGYRTAITWVAEGPTPLFMAGTFTPAAGAGTVRLVRRGDTVTATLAFPPGDGLAAGSAHLFTVPTGFRPVEAATWTVPAAAQVPVGDGDDPEAARGAALELRVHRDGRVTQTDPPRQVGFAATAVWRTADPEWMEVRGTYVPTRGGGTGTYSLRRDGTRVTATVTVAYGVPPASVLFTVPAGFRPAQTVRRALAVDKAGCHTRTLEVRPQGTVRLVGEPAETGTEPLVHATTMTWTAGADVCQRHVWVRARLLQALRSKGRVRDSCAEVTWTDLASVQSLDLNAASTLRAWLEGTPPLQAHDLAGLTGLRTLALQGDVWFPAVPPDLLFHTPALESLDLSGSRMGLPPDFLAYAPGLRRLTLRDVDPEGLSFLPPRLEVLDWEIPAGRTALPPDLLHVPELRSLTLRAAGLTTLPADLLAHVPQLQRLTLDTPRLTALPVDFRTDTPNLREVREPGGCAVSATDPADRPHLLARFLDACGNP